MDYSLQNVDIHLSQMTMLGMLWKGLCKSGKAQRDMIKGIKLQNRRSYSAMVPDRTHSYRRKVLSDISTRVSRVGLWEKYYYALCDMTHYSSDVGFTDVVRSTGQSGAKTEYGSASCARNEYSACEVLLWREMCKIDVYELFRVKCLSVFVQDLEACQNKWLERHLWYINVSRQLNHYSTLEVGIQLAQIVCEKDY